MVEQKLCPNCGAAMDLGDIYIKGKAKCPTCGFQGLPVAESKILTEVKKKREEGMPEDHSHLGMDGLLGKFATICAGMLVISISQGAFSLAIVSLAGMLLFGISHFVKRRIIRGK